MTPTLIAVPQTNEIDCLISGFRNAGVAVSAKRIGHLEAYDLQELGTCLTEGGHGKAQFAATTSYLLCHYREAELLVCAGAAGSLSSDLKTGDVVVSTVTVEHDYRVKFMPQPSPEHASDVGSVEQLRQLVEDVKHPFSVRFGKIASGDEDIVDGQRANELREQTGALCVAWEGSGGARAAKIHDKRFVEIRAITDVAEKNAATDFRTNLAIAMPNISRLLVDWLSERSR